jgi:cellulose synthase/poly-beta-1,6-N-acetylglucosamine synthase-like glycosyltransferase
VYNPIARNKQILWFNFSWLISTLLMACTTIIFWIFIAFLLYAYIGYGIIATTIAFVHSITKKQDTVVLEMSLPKVTLIVPAYNELDILPQKIHNTLALDYPTDLLDIIFITDGSTDDCSTLLQSFSNMLHLHQPERKGKMAAMNRAMQFVKTPIVVFSDANTLLNSIAIREMVRHYANETIGGVAGEKKVIATQQDNLVGQGEGLYWKYESAMKQLDSNLYTVVAAAGELFSIRTNLYIPLPEDTVLDDLVLAISTCKQGYTIAYEKNAYAIETPSINLYEERKRKIRIAAGAAQAVARLGIVPSSTNWMLNFQFFSRRIIRWIISPIALPIILTSNILLVIQYRAGMLYQTILLLQLCFYTMAFVGWIMYKWNKKSMLLFVPFYFVFMNSCMLIGFIKQMLGKQKATWDKAKRVQLPKTM